VFTNVPRAASVKNKFDAAIVSPVTTAVVSNDLDQPVKDSRALEGASALKLGPDLVAVRRVTPLKPQLQLPDCLLVSEPLPRDAMVLPPKGETLVRRTETTPQDVVERVEIAASRWDGDKHPADLVVEAFEGRERPSIDLIGRHQPKSKRPRLSKRVYA
jgi:hypothetical protein